MENTSRTRFLNSIMRVTHRDLDPIVEDFRSMLEQDPDFAVRGCVYLANGGSEIRDVADAAIITLLTSDSKLAVRSAGKAVLLGQDVYDISPDGEYAGLPPFRILRVLSRITKNGNKAPRLMKAVATDYLRFLESNPQRFDGVALRNRKAMKAAYTTYHIRPSARAQAVLFDNRPPADSKLAVLKQIANTKDITEQARLVIEHRIPYTVASSVLPKIGPEVGVALIAAMTPQEAINSRAWVEKSGLLAIPEVKAVYVDKVSRASGSASTADHRKSAQGTDTDVQEAVAKAKEAAATKRKATMRTLLVVDRSGSMSAAIAAAVEMGSRVGPMFDSLDELRVVVTNDYASEIKVTRNSLAGWQDGFRMVRAGGRTSIAAGINLGVSGFEPRMICIVTDGGENIGVAADAIKRYSDRVGFEPVIVVLRVPGDPDSMTPRMERAGFRVEKFESDGKDYYVFDQIAAILGGDKPKSLVEKIMETPIPTVVGKKI